MTFAFLISFLAGISTVLGSLILFFNYNKKEKIINISLSFASGIMLSVSLFELIPTSISGLKNIFHLLPSILISAIFLISGVVLSLTISKYLPDFDKTKDDKLYKLGIFSMIAIMLHNIPEDCSCYASQ